MTRSTPRNTPSRAPAYVVGDQSLQRPLVSVEHVKGHLRLLRMFSNLRKTVEECKDHRIPSYAMQMDKEARWRWFVHLAAERFERWVRTLQFVTLERFVAEHIPPSDVWMVWHAYLLSPCWYAEDCDRLAVLQQLRLLNMFVVASINLRDVVRKKPSNKRLRAWYKQTGRPFDPFDAMTVPEDGFKQLECPRCRTSVFSPYAADDGTGFTGKNFSVTCPLPGCRLKITHDNLAVAKFVRDLSQRDDEQGQFVAGSLYSPLGKRDTRQAKIIRDQLFQSAYFAELCPLPSSERLARLDRVKEVKEKIGYSLARLKHAVSTSLRNFPAAQVSRILSAYTNGSLFSVDLVDAVLRQCQFTEQINKLGWLKPDAFREKHEILSHSVTRYHAFLDLMTAYPDSILVPTLDIDLVWHTHQLMASRYKVDCEMYVGHYVDHEVSIVETRLSSAFDNTRRIWQARFQAPYMQCGCSTLDETSVHKFVRKFRYCIRGRSQLQVELHPEHLPATHPSAHNALLTFQTACTGTFGKLHHTNKKREDAPSRSPSPHLFKKTQRIVQLDLDASPTHSPTMLLHPVRALPALPGR